MTAATDAMTTEPTGATSAEMTPGGRGSAARTLNAEQLSAAVLRVAPRVAT